MNASIDSVDDYTNIIDELEYKPFFWGFSIITIVLFFYAIRYARKYNTIAAFLIPPILCICIIIDNIVMAIVGIDRREALVHVKLVLHASITSLILIDCYEVAYLVHKHKSVNFCGISFERGRRNRSRGNYRSMDQILSNCQRLGVWMVGLGIFILNLFTAYYWPSKDIEPTLLSIYDLDEMTQTQLIISILPHLTLVVVSLYLGLQLWNYGMCYSYVVHATCFNPWIWMLIGSIMLFFGYVLPSPIYPVSSNAGEVLMMASIIRMFREVHHDVQQGQQMRSFIDDPALIEHSIGIRFGQNLSVNPSPVHTKYMDFSLVLSDEGIQDTGSYKGSIELSDHHQQAVDINDINLMLETTNVLSNTEQMETMNTTAKETSGTKVMEVRRAEIQYNVSDHPSR